MSQTNNPLDPQALELVEAALKVLEDRGAKNDVCPRCKTHEWTVEPIAISAIPVRGIPAVTPHAYFPAQLTLIQIVCKNCGYTMFHNLNVLGLARPTYR